MVGMLSGVARKVVAHMAHNHKDVVAAVVEGMADICLNKVGNFYQDRPLEGVVEGLY